MNVNKVWTLAGAQAHLKVSSSNQNILNDIKEVIYSWKYKSEYDLESIKVDLTDIVEQAIIYNFKDNINNEIRKSISCIVYNDIYENLIPLIRGTFSKADLYLYEKCTHFCKKNVTPGQFGSTVYNSLPFVAAIVELSVLDNYKSPLEKINCLCSTYDLIFAELKLALVSIISKYSERECEIPVINNEEVIPILMVVIIKSKLLYLWSNLYYIKFFGSDILEENDDARSIVGMYETVVAKLTDLEESSLSLNCERIPTNLDVAETIAILSSEECGDMESPISLKEERKRRLISLITSSTTEKNYIPLDVAKIFSS